MLNNNKGKNNNIDTILHSNDPLKVGSGLTAECICKRCIVEDGLFGFITIIYQYMNCFLALNPCSSNPCQNGTCSSLASGYKCTCHSGYSGVNCDKGLKTFILTCITINGNYR